MRVKLDLKLNAIQGPAKHLSKHFCSLLVPEHLLAHLQALTILWSSFQGLENKKENSLEFPTIQDLEISFPGLLQSLFKVEMIYF